jgi:hypothetical protein
MEYYFRDMCSYLVKEFTHCQVQIVCNPDGGPYKCNIFKPYSKDGYIDIFCTQSCMRIIHVNNLNRLLIMEYDKDNNPNLSYLINYLLISIEYIYKDLATHENFYKLWHKGESIL